MIEKLPLYSPMPMRTVGRNWLYQLKVWFVDRRAYIIEDDYYYQLYEGTTLKIPAGFCTDFASSPRFSWLFGMDPTGILLVPSLFHDFGYRHDFYLDSNGNKIWEGEGKGFHDLLLRDICEQVNDMKVPAEIAYASLTAFGWLAWKADSKTHDGELHLRGKY